MDKEILRTRIEDLIEDTVLSYHKEVNIPLGCDAIVDNADKILKLVDKATQEMLKELADYIDVEIGISILNYASSHTLKEEIMLIIRSWKPN